MKNQKIIIVVDDNNANLIACKNILKPHYMVYTVLSARKMFELMEHITPDLILLDVEMPDMDGYEAGRKLKNNSAYRDIPFFFLTARSDATSELEGLNLGALDYIHKPFFSALLLRRISMHLSLFDFQKKLKALNGFIVKLFVNILDKEADGPLELRDEFNLINLLDIVTDTVKTCEKQRNVSFSLGEGIPLNLSADVIKLSRLVRNLLLSSMDYVPEGKGIVLSVKKEEETENEVTLRFGIADNGVEIGEERQKVLFFTINVNKEKQEVKE